MASTMSKDRPSHEVNRLDSVRPVMAKAVTPSHTVLRDVIEDVLRRLGNMKATAADMGIDRAQLYRQLQGGTLTVARLETLGPDFAAELGRLLLESFGPLATPQARARQRIRDARAILDELDQLTEFVA
jgi:hypothetical protein